MIQWIFLGDLRSATIVGLNIPFALFFCPTILLVMQGESANLLSVGAVDFGIIVDSGRDPSREYLPEFSARPGKKGRVCSSVLAEGSWGPPDPTRSADHTTAAQGWTGSTAADSGSAPMQVDKAVLFSPRSSPWPVSCPLFTMQGVEGQIFGPMARTYGYALAGALLATFTVTPAIASMLLPKNVKEAETIVVRLLHRLQSGAAVRARSPSPLSTVGSASPFWRCPRIPGDAAGQRISPPPGRR